MKLGTSKFKTIYLSVLFMIMLFWVFYYLSFDWGGKSKEVKKAKNEIHKTDWVPHSLWKDCQKMLTVWFSSILFMVIYHSVTFQPFLIYCSFACSHLPWKQSWLNCTGYEVSVLWSISTGYFALKWYIWEREPMFFKLCYYMMF